MSKTRTDTTGTHTWLVLMKAHRALGRHADRTFKANAIGLSEFVVLEMLLHKGPQKVNDIGRKIGLTSGAITSAVDRLEERAWVTRGFDPHDRRARIVTLTPAGKVLIRRIFGVHVRTMEQAASGLTHPERSTLISLLKKLGIHAEEQIEGEAE